ncbi:MAG: hypothetical protein Q4D15_10535, partial [Lachnospiraceae bacterium]|nr:hypothetical protein [Lachnospiraceae bacterium]
MKWFRLIVVLPLVCLLVITNIYEDPANVFHNESKEIAEALIDGHSAYSATGNGNERKIKEYLIMRMPDVTDCIAVGPSLVMCVNKDIVGTESFINLGVSGSDLYDILAQFGLMHVYGKEAERVILCMDSYSFDENFYAKADARNAELMPYSKYMLQILDGESPQPIHEENTNTIKTEATQAFSISYFQAAWDQVALNGTYAMNDKRWGIVQEDFDGSRGYYDNDGSWTYAAAYQANSVSTVRKKCAGYDIEKQFSRGCHISKYSKTVFDKLISYLRDQGTEVELFLCPLAPSLWDRIEAEKDHYVMFDELTAFVAEMSKKYDLKITGDY